MPNVFRFKGQIPNEVTSGVVYKVQWGLCNETYYGETLRHLVVWSGEHIGLSPLTNKNHLLVCNHTPSLDDFSVLAHEDKKFRLEIKKVF